MRRLSRRTVLRGAGTTLALPWMESLVPRGAHAQDTEAPKRLIVVFFPNGTAPFWRPQKTGQGNQWALSSILEPFGELKSKMTVLSNVENYSAYQKKSDVDKVHGTRPGCFLNCANVKKNEERSGISVDQVLAQSPYGDLTPFRSLQLSAGTSRNGCDGVPCSYSRTISWKGPTEPLAPAVNPTQIFSRLVGSPKEQESEIPSLLKKSALDAVRENAAAVRLRLGGTDRVKLEEFEDIVRSVELRAVAVSSNATTCQPGEAPTLRATFGDSNGKNGYSKETHTDVMNDLISLAVRCDSSRIITHMLENERSTFVCDHVRMRNFTQNGSTQASGRAGEYHQAQHSNPRGFASITHWNATKVADLCRQLDAIEDAPGVSALDNSVVMFASCMEGGNHSGHRLPVALLGSGGGRFKTNTHIDLGGGRTDERPLRDLYLTFLNSYFGMDRDQFGNNAHGTPNRVITELLA